MKIEVAEERKEINIPISEVVMEGGILNIFPYVKKYFSIDYKPRNDKLSLVAGGFIGLVPINKGLAIDIKPKFSISNLIRIVSIAEDRFNSLEFISKKYQKNDECNSIVFEFIVESLIVELKKLDSEGVLKEYIHSVDFASKIRGRINFKSSINSLWSNGSFNKASIEYFELSIQNPLNKLIKYTLLFCLDKLDLPINKKLKKSIILYYSYFESVSIGKDLSFLNEADIIIDNRQLSDLRNYYYPICDICRLLIERKGVSFNEEGSNVDLRSFTLDMASIFEKYLINSIRANKGFFPLSTSIQDGNKEGKKKLYNQPSALKSDAKPDILIKIDGVYRIILDAKYKESTKDTDKYQVISHALSYGANIAILVLPRNKLKHQERLFKLGDVGDVFKIDVYEYYFDLSNENLKQEETLFSKNISSLI